jgi:hypothetical protein
MSTSDVERIYTLGITNGSCWHGLMGCEFCEFADLSRRRITCQHFTEAERAYSQYSHCEWWSRQRHRLPLCSINEGSKRG